MEELKDLKKVGLFIDNYFPLVDGVIRVVDNYARNFKINGIDVDVITPKYRVYDDSNLPYHTIRTKSFYVGAFEYPIPTPKRTKGLKKQLLEGDYDIFHAHSPFYLGRYALKIGKKKKIPVVATFHSKFYDDFYQRTKSRLLSKILTRYVVSFFERCDEVWAVNNHTKNTLLSYGYKGKEIYVMENGTNFVCPSNRLELRKKKRKELQLNDDTPVLLFVGHLIWQKNIKVILDSLNILKNKGITFQMFFVGEGGNEKAIHAYVDKLQLNDCVTFLGALKKTELLQEIYACADLFYFPSLYDNAPLVLREASVMKLPSLLAKGSNSAEKTVDFENGFTADANPISMAEKIEEILKIKDQLPLIGEKASQTIPVTCEKVIQDVEARYKEIIANYHKSK